ncbi:MAG TPA: outer membrane protein assembly factor BamA, partial [Anaeromyxobacteraceae bacterium]|nr:outer membrane protein assembly factor BamA [Anaeromyxobacteraceae bacterium]
MTRLVLLGSALALALGSPARAAGPVVSQVLVEGNRRVEADAIRAALATKPGEPLDLAKIDEDIRAVMKLGFFSDVEVEERGDPDHPDLVVRVVEKPAVRDFKITGNKELSNDDLKDTVEQKANAILDLNLVKKSARKIQDKYVEKGYFLAEVTYRLEDRPDNQVSLIFEVSEHAKVEVKEIRFIGNQNLSRDELLGAMSTQEGSYLSLITSAGNYREEVFQRDLQNLQFVYGDHGYIYAKVGKPVIALSPDKHYLYITLHIEEGEQYRIGQIDFSGELLHDKAELFSTIQVKPGEIFSRSRVGKDLIAVADIYRDDGYAYTNVNPETKVDAKNRIVDLTYDIQPGRKCYFERIEISGNDKTRDKVIRRELRIYEGELFSNKGLNASKARVTALGFFESVNITTERGTADDKIVARVMVKERSTGSFQVGAGYSSYENLILTAQISQNNFLGWGQTLSLQLSYSSIRQLGQIEFVEPYFFDTKWTFATNVYVTEGVFSTFQRKAIGGSLTWGYELSGLSWLVPWASHLEDVRLFATYTNEFVTVTPTGLNLVNLNNQ